ncbi:3-deoxy-manno-octulosonate cytidylyltransferase [Leptospira kanakyensis]|uniref:3-deoxy-manno-octulosonate cytidylyltransferase n=1 Tax=Leptospira kanakyensis TaxID=2484968 RepID=UPI00223E6394|nr:3-deoxy-manno-octulosonate cytidylyltransferase [Leptospira kanakyensis]MCW7482129.1 3-deoxy-manno-octulosonate cytidylyltransferase [Leptospira kanakyensis]
MKVLGLIPARMGSSRFPGKPMAKILGKPMIGHVYENVIQSKSLDSTYVATCDKEIFDYILSIGGNAVMTSSAHERASDRCAEALLAIEKEKGFQYDIIVMIQGDEPMTKSEMIDEAINPMLSDKSIKIVNLLAPIESLEEFEDRNCIKVVCDLNGNAIYFSREPIPTRSKTNSIDMQKQVCIIPFVRNFLIEYTKLVPTPLEIAESVDMMRVLEHGFKVKMIPTNYKSYAVDTPEDLVRVEKILSSNI